LVTNTPAHDTEVRRYEVTGGASGAALSARTGRNRPGRTSEVRPRP
jgi:hypothetical protein